ncbi:NUDIX hydrolase [Polaribacter pacificus]|nr:NUDIX domain-containing protein [Polaribacter pacificus]
MYKVFVNDRPIILTDSLKVNNNYPVYIFKEIVVDEIIHKLQTSKEDGINVFTEALEKDWIRFQDSFKVVKAAGGLVLNELNEFLFIYRGQRWDLPKGGIEKGESIEQTAVREVEEECGIHGLHIERPLLTTYHVFFQNDLQLLKVTDWFLMQTQYKGELQPQLEEGITIVQFVSESQLATITKNTYANILLVLEAYQKND